EVVAEPVASKEIVPTPMEAVVVKEVVEPWKFGGRVYFETEDFDNESTVAGGDHEDGTFWGTGISATKGKLTLDLGVERRFGGDTSFVNTDAEWQATRVDWKVRYQLFANQAFHLKYRTEDRVRDYSKSTYHGDFKRTRYELGTDFNHFNGLLGGWLVAGIDRDKRGLQKNVEEGEIWDGSFSSDYGRNLRTNEEKGFYWEGDFGPTFKLTEKLSLKPTLYTTGEFYDSYEMVETQIRIMMPYQVNDKLTIMPRIRVTLDRNFDNIAAVDPEIGGKLRQYEHDFGTKIRYELMANYVINDQFSTFVGFAYENATREYSNFDNIQWSQKNGDRDIDLFWTYIGLNYKFN
ncbi:MAG: hypothetical protein ACRC6B_04385, partial [Fusobacteriaceae bacterium]